jgi:hypothetical protein
MTTELSLTAEITGGRSRLPPRVKTHFHTVHKGRRNAAKGGAIPNLSHCVRFAPSRIFLSEYVVPLTIHRLDACDQHRSRLTAICHRSRRSIAVADRRLRGGSAQHGLCPGGATTGRASPQQHLQFALPVHIAAIVSIQNTLMV